MPKKKKEKPSLSRIATGAFSRTFAIGKMTVEAAAKGVFEVASATLSGGDGRSIGQRLLASQIQVLAKEFGKLKGSLMKAGQMLSVYGEHFLPPEINSHLKQLQKDSPPVAWAAMEKALRRQLTSEVLATLDIEKEAWGAASIGQVHRARRKGSTAESLATWDICLKIQYPGIDRVIESDLKVLRSIFSVLKLLPRSSQTDSIFEEIRSMLKREVDYDREAEATVEYGELVGADARYVVPNVFAELSNRRVLATSFEEGVALDSEEVRAISQERRNALGAAALDLFLKEFFQWAFMQTDPHFGNYRVRLRQASGEYDQLILLDFGAVRRFPKSFLDPYYAMVKSAKDNDRLEFDAACQRLQLIPEGAPEPLKDGLWDLARMIMEPFLEHPPFPESAPWFKANGCYDWGNTDLPRRVSRRLTTLILNTGINPPPKEFVFLDRKLTGVFIFLHHLRAVVPSRAILESNMPAT